SLAGESLIANPQWLAEGIIDRSTYEPRARLCVTEDSISDFSDLSRSLSGGNGDPGAAAVDHRRIADLVEQIKESADKLASDHTSRGDLKILSRTLRELRYAFKVFTPYRSRRKVTVFGSARTPKGEPGYEQAVHFGRAMAKEGWLVVTGAASGIM